MIRYVCIKCGKGVTDPTGDWTKTHVEYFCCEKCINREVKNYTEQKETPDAVPKLQDGNRTS